MNTVSAQVLNKIRTWGGDMLVLAEVEGQKRVFIGRRAHHLQKDGPEMAKDITEYAKGKTVAVLGEKSFDDFHALPLVPNMPKALRDAIGGF